MNDIHCMAYVRRVTSSSLPVNRQHDRGFPYSNAFDTDRTAISTVLQTNVYSVAGW